jgi:hypothetical protein
MHIENELVEFATTGEQEYEEVIEEYEEEIPIQEGVLEPPVTDTADTAPAQGKPWCTTLILLITVYIYLLCIYVIGKFMETACICISTYKSY